MTRYRVCMSDRFIETAVLGVIEAQRFGDGPKRRRSVEMLGLVWGRQRVTGGARTFFLESLTTSVSAERMPNSVDYHPKAVKLMADLIRELAPDLTLLGDMHSHPYASRDAVGSTGYDFSASDFEAGAEFGEVWTSAEDHPVMVVVTSCKLKAGERTQRPKQLRSNLWQFDVAGFRCWVNASVGYKDRDDKRYTGNKHSPVRLELPVRFLDRANPLTA